ncbi:MAG: FMN-binding glutamate synthase family protein [Gammaproteobacteria bacterium]|nr:FMN-binding glutamate synthase family protein [Gammaproteobacteria bacterium]
MRKHFYIVSTVALLILLLLSTLWPLFTWLFLVVLFLTLLGYYDIFQTRHTLWRNFPVIAHIRWLLEGMRVPIQQYFVESDTGGAPTNRMFRSVVYQRAKRELDTLPLGTRVDVYRTGYEWMDHSLGATPTAENHALPRIMIGGPECTQPYSSSLLNISAMSFGALSSNAIEALNRGAQAGQFAHNTGEGSISPAHRRGHGALIWQIGTGYFGCRDNNGRFSPEKFQEHVQDDPVKMIEIKLSQGAKPGHGGILPAEKNTPEIAAIRGLRAFERVDSPATHTAFSNPIEMMHFIQQLRELARGKPVGIKLCLGRRSEFVGLCKAMVLTGVKPDFITVDGGEGGTGAAPLEFSNSVGFPLREGLAFIADCLTGFGLRNDIRIIASGKILTGFHIIKNLALGADICQSARGMMMALGCIQALQCNKNTCPTGIATQDPELSKSLNIEDKAQRVANYHAETLKSVQELLAAAGIQHLEALNRSHIHRRISATTIARYDEIYPYVEKGSMLAPPYPERYRMALSEGSAEYFVSKTPTVQVEDALKQTS